MLSPGDPGSIANGVLGGVAAGTELTLDSKWLPIKLFCFGGVLFILILRTLKLNVANGDTAPFSLNYLVS